MDDGSIYNTSCACEVCRREKLERRRARRAFGIFATPRMPRGVGGATRRLRRKIEERKAGNPKPPPLASPDEVERERARESKREAQRLRRKNKRAEKSTKV